VLFLEYDGGPSAGSDVIQNRQIVIRESHSSSLSREARLSELVTNQNYFNEYSVLFQSFPPCASVSVELCKVILSLRVNSPKGL
jgi:hypothetical protein